MQSACLSLVIINVFQMTVLLLRTYYLKEQETNYVSIYLKNNDLKQLTIENWNFFWSSSVKRNTVFHSSNFQK